MKQLRGKWINTLKINREMHIKASIVPQSKSTLIAPLSLRGRPHFKLECAIHFQFIFLEMLGVS